MKLICINVYIYTVYLYKDVQYNKKTRRPSCKWVICPQCPMGLFHCKLAYVPVYMIRVLRHNTHSFSAYQTILVKKAIHSRVSKLSLFHLINNY